MSLIYLLIVKLLLNTCQVYGKFCEDLKKRRAVHFCTDADEYRKHVSSPLFESNRPISEKCMQVNVRSSKC